MLQLFLGILLMVLFEGSLWCMGPHMRILHFEFIDELDHIMGTWQSPTILGRDFNLVRKQKEKSNENINFTHANAFNEWINRWALIEISDPTRFFTWFNNQKKAYHG
jgi:hypothetical protein